MRNYHIFYFLLALVVFQISCKSDNTKSNKSSQTSAEKLIEEGYTIIPDSGISPDMIEMWNKSALNILEHRIKEDDESYAIIEDKVWEYQFIHSGGEMSKPGQFAGHWLDFLDDNTYEYGIGKDIKGGGRYHYSPMTTLLLMVDNNQSIKPREHKLSIAGDIFVFSGSGVYKDNGTQGKLVRIAQRP